MVYKWKEPGVITTNLVKQINQYTLSLSKAEYNSTKYDEKGNEIFKFYFFIAIQIVPNYYVNKKKSNHRF